MREKLNTKNQIDIINNEEFKQVRVITINNEPWFVGKDIAEALGYSRATKAIQDRVDEDDKKMINSKTQSCFGIELGQRGGYIINESGLYSLILSSKLPSAKQFKRWVTSEVLPTIRRTGSYSLNSLEQELYERHNIPTTLPEALRLAADLKEENERLLPKPKMI